MSIKYLVKYITVYQNILPIIHDLAKYMPQKNADKAPWALI